jgi:signal transduction histidine kinase
MAWFRLRQLPTTAAGAEVVLLIAFVGLRGLDLAQALVALPAGLARSPRPVLDAVALGVLTAESVLLAAVVLRRGRYDDAKWGLLDVATGVAVLISTLAFTVPQDRFTSWADWGYPVTLSTALGAGIGLRRWRDVLCATSALTIGYLVTTIGAFGHPSDHSTAVTNALSYFTFAVLARLMAGYLRRMGDTADAARAEAARLAADAERERHRLLLHDQAAVLGLVANSDPDEHLMPAARAQAAAGHARIRAFLSDTPTITGTLSAELAAVASEFEDLPLTVNIDLATDDLAPQERSVVAEAVRTVLHNARRHAQASSVVLHAENTRDRWEVTVADNGVGFDPQATPFGFGLSQQVLAAVTRSGGTATITSAPDEGTTIQLSGHLPPAQSGHDHTEHRENHVPNP